MIENIVNSLSQLLDEDRVRRNASIAEFTTFRVGGNADALVLPETEEELILAVKMCREAKIPFYILGNGSNMLVSDKGFNGVVIVLKAGTDRIVLEKTDSGAKISAPAGISLSAMAMSCAQEGLCGFEFGAGIPGTLGGAVVMNAGAYGGEMKDILSSVRVLDADGQVISVDAKELDLSYRHSNVSEKQWIVLSGTVELKYGDKAAVLDTIRENNKKRREKQPLEYPSAGSTFKRPEGYFAGKLIEDAGLKGFSVGGAQVSEKHAGFVINTGDATAADIYELINTVSERVKAEFKVSLEPEVRFLGDF